MCTEQCRIPDKRQQLQTSGINIHKATLVLRARLAVFSRLAAAVALAADPDTFEPVIDDADDS